MALPLVLQHGAGQDAETWSDVLPLLSGEIYVHETPGHGSRPGTPLTDIDALADDLLASIPYPPERPVLLCGHSLGGAIVLTAALKAPERVAGVVTVATGMPKRIDPRMLTALREGHHEQVAEFVRLALLGTDPESAPAEHQASAERIVSIWRRIGGEAIAADYLAVDASRLAEELEPLGRPVAVLAGGDDGLVPPRRVRMLADALGVDARVVEGVTHQIVWEDPQAVVEAIDKVRAEVG